HQDLRDRNGAQDRHDGHGEEQLDQGVSACGAGLRAVGLPAARHDQSRSVLGVLTVTSVFNFRKFFSPMPRTFISSSGFLKPPFFCRYSTIRSAVALPMPGSASSCAAVAVLRLMGAVAA